MKASFVAQGLKSLLHPQLPLSAKESQRLLTALTSSFRKHLDYVHPGISEDGQKANVRSDATKPNSNANAGRSSAADFADKHLASVLTSPLFILGPKAKIVLTIADVRKELAKSPQDPIQLLEQWHEQGVATVEIAYLCLEATNKHLVSMSPETAEQEVNRMQPGQRVLLWLLKSKLFATAAFVDHRPFHDLMIYLLRKENCENRLWDWLKLDMPTHDNNLSQGTPQSDKGAHSRYRWRGRLLSHMVQERLAACNIRTRAQSLNALHAGMDIFHEACELKLSGLYISLVQAKIVLLRSIKNFQSIGKVDPRRFDRLLASLHLCNEVELTLHMEVERAHLMLIHPRNPTGIPAYKVLQRLFAPNPSPETARVLASFWESQAAASLYWYRLMLRTLTWLRENAMNVEAAWLAPKISEAFPKSSRFVE